MKVKILVSIVDLCYVQHERKTNTNIYNEKENRKRYSPISVTNLFSTVLLTVIL